MTIRMAFVNTYANISTYAALHIKIIANSQQVLVLHDNTFVVNSMYEALERDQLSQKKHHLVQ